MASAVDDDEDVVDGAAVPLVNYKECSCLVE